MLPDDPIYIKAFDFLSRDLLTRYGQTVEKSLDGAVQIPTDFRMESASGHAFEPIRLRSPPSGHAPATSRQRLSPSAQG